MDFYIGDMAVNVLLYIVAMAVNGLLYSGHGSGQSWRGWEEEDG